MFGWRKRRKSEEEEFFEDLERRKARGGPAEPFRMTVEDVFVIGGGRGCSAVVTGRIEAGRVSRGDRLTLESPCGTRALTVAGIESFRKMLETARAGDRVGLLFQNLGDRDWISTGDILMREEGEG